jgi:hypothetical protein
MLRSKEIDMGPEVEIIIVGECGSWFPMSVMRVVGFVEGSEEHENMYEIIEQDLDEYIEAGKVLEYTKPLMFQPIEPEVGEGGSQN